MTKRKRERLSLSGQLWFYLGSTVALVVLMLIGYWLDINLALPAFLLFMLLVTVVNARQERAEREAEEEAEEIVDEY
ncbi:MAG: hypothetical protein MAG451_02266 [Anaerolineales bacterium]|nr:hypothetical protein [Anaerolineales bacterium]